MRITVNPCLDMETLRWVSNDGAYEYVGPLAYFKGDKTVKAAETSQNSFDSSLQNIFQSQYATQKQNLDYLTSKMKPQIDAGGTGYTPQQLTSMRTGATDTNSAQFQNARAALQNSISQRSGGSKLTGVSGASTEADAALLNSAAQTEAGSQEQITAQNANLQQSNYWNAINTLNGVAAQNNPLGYASSATTGTGAVANASQAYTSSNQSQLLGALGGIVGGAASGWASGGFKMPGCFVAAALYGWHNLKTHVVRMWMNHSAPSWFHKFYIRNGPWIAKTPLRFAFWPFFECVLRFA
jgi:hypothetical protein